MILPLVVFGAGGHGKVVADALLAAGERVAGFLDDRTPVGSLVMGLPVLGTAAWLRDNHARVALGVGSNAARERVAALCVGHGAILVAAVHPRAYVAASATVAEGVVVMALAVVNPEAVIERGAILNSGAVVEHDCVVGAFAHVSPNASMGGGCTLQAGAQLGIGAIMLPATIVGQRSVVGGGAVVTANVPSDAVVVGIPARAHAHAHEAKT